MVAVTQVKKSRRDSLKGTGYKRIEAERSSAIGQKIMEKYDSDQGVKYVRRRNNKKILDELSIAGNGDLNSKKLLDIGCGFGDFLADAQSVMDCVYGADMSLPQAQKARKRVSNRSCVTLADGESLPFKSGCFDFIVMKGIIHHLGSPDRAFKEAKRLLKESGTLVILEGTPTSWYRRFFLFIADMIGMEHEVSLFPLL
jgi:ubiquinone/menaquinone biosynthesis C-methylase UbiE